MYYFTVAQLAQKINNLERFDINELQQEKDNDYRQFIADIYHCLNCWGIKQSEQEMLVNLEQWRQEIEPGEYCPNPSQAAVCAAYWNHLCDIYPD